METQKVEDLQFPKNGFYMHYKHDPNGEPYNYMYEVVGIGRNTETKTYTVLYRPLYKNDWMPPADYQSRPIELFFADVEWNGKTLPRFQEITDPEMVAGLNQQKKLLYP